MQSKKNLGRVLAIIVSLTMMLGLVPVVGATPVAFTLTDIAIGSDSINVSTIGTFPTAGVIMGYAVGSADPNEVTHELYLAMPTSGDIVIDLTFSGDGATKYKQISRTTAGSALSGAPMINDATISESNGVTTLTVTDVKAALDGDQEYWLYAEDGTTLLAAIRIMKTAKTETTVSDASGNDDVSLFFSSELTQYAVEYLYSDGDFKNGTNHVEFWDYNADASSEWMGVAVISDEGRYHSISIKINGTAAILDDEYFSFDSAPLMGTGIAVMTADLLDVTYYIIPITDANVYTVNVTFRTPSNEESSSDEPVIYTGVPAPVAPVSPAAADNALAAAVAVAEATGSNTAKVLLTNPGEISLETLQGMELIAGMNVRIYADSLTKDGNAVDVRIALDPSDATKSLDLSASTTNETAQAIDTLFDKWFRNDVTVISFGHRGGFGQSVEVAVKVDPSLNTDNLYFYAYDAATNTYSLIPNANYWVDANGYVHFSTSVGGSILITDSALTRR